MRRRIPILVILLVVLFSCVKKQSVDSQSETISEITANKKDSVQQRDDDLGELADRLHSALKDYTPIQIGGKWRSQSIVDTLSVHLYSRKFKCEIASPLLFGDEFDYEGLIWSVVELEPIIYILNNNSPTDTLKIGGANGQLFGLYFAINEGDMDGDGLDELVYMVDWADSSSLNTFHIASYKNNTWVDLFNFPVWEWQFDEGYGNVIQKLPDGKIMINYRNDEANEEARIVDLKEISGRHFKY